jgi:hypothetical protein
MRPEYREWLRRDDFIGLSCRSPIVHAAICADSEPVDLILALAVQLEKAQEEIVRLHRISPMPLVMVKR